MTPNVTAGVTAAQEADVLIGMHGERDPRCTLWCTPWCTPRGATLPQLMPPISLMCRSEHGQLLDDAPKEQRYRDHPLPVHPLQLFRPQRTGGWVGAWGGEGAGAAQVGIKEGLVLLLWLILCC